MIEGYPVSGLELRYLLTTLHVDAGRPLEIHDLVDWMETNGYAVAGRPGKTISDALRWEVRRGRVVRVGTGRYGPGRMPRQTKSRIRARVRAVADAAARARLANALAEHSVAS